MVNTKTFTGSTVIPPDGYVLTYDSADGYYKPRSLPSPGQIMSLNNTTSSPYNVGDEDVVIVGDHAGVFTVILPVLPGTGRTIFIKDGYGAAGINPINVTPSIDGTNPYPISDNFGVIRVIWDGTRYLILSKVP